MKCKKAKYEKEEETEPMVLVEFREEDSEQRSVATKSANAVRLYCVLLSDCVFESAYIMGV